MSLQKIKAGFEKQGKDDFVMIGINAESAAEPATAKKMLGPSGEVTFPMLQAESKAKGWGAFGGKKNDCFIYFNNGVLAKKHIGKATVNLGEFENDVKTGLTAEPE